MPIPSRATTTARKLTVAIIARDAGDILPETLVTAKRLADEIVVVDNGSRDNTADIARVSGAVVVTRVWDRSFAAARNAAIEKATGQWILWLDAGERMTTESAAALRQFVDQSADPTKAYLLAVTVPAAPGNISGEQTARLRLMPQGHGLRYEGRVRERLQPTIETVGLTLEGLPWRIQRGPRENDAQVRLNRARRNLELVTLDMAERGEQPCLLVARGEAQSGLGEPQAAAKSFRRAIELASPTSTALREAYYGLLTTYDADLANRETQIKVCLEALEKFPLDAQLLCAMGGYMQAQGQLELSTRAYRMAVDFGQVDPQTWHVPDIQEIATICLSLTHQLQGNDPEGRQVLEQALARNAEAQRVRRHLIDLHIRCDRRKEALAEVDRLPSSTPHREALRGAIRGACLAAQRNWVPALAYLQAAYAAGCRDLLCLRWLSVTLLSSGLKQQALPVLQEWLTLDPRSVEAQKYLEAAQQPTNQPGAFPYEPAVTASTAPAPAPAAPAPATTSKYDGDTRRLRLDGPKTGSPGALAIPKLAPQSSTARK